MMLAFLGFLCSMIIILCDQYGSKFYLKEAAMVNMVAITIYYAMANF